MAISSFSNPIPDLVQGLLQGHALGLQMHAQRQADQKFKTDQILHQQQVDANTIMQQMNVQHMQGVDQERAQHFDRYTNPVQNGMVQDRMNTTLPGNPGSPGAAPGEQSTVYNLPTQQGPSLPTSYDYMRKADPSNTVDLTNYKGKLIRQGEIKTPDQQREFDVNQQAQAETQLMRAKALAQQQDAQMTRQNTIKMEGNKLKAPAGWDAWPEGTPMTRGEYDTERQKQQASVSADQVPLAEGGALVSRSTGKVIASRDPKLDAQESYVEAAAQDIGKTTKTLTGTEKLKFITNYKRDPEAAAQRLQFHEDSMGMQRASQAQTAQAHQDAQTNQQRAALDRETTQHGKAFDEISKGADSQLDKILDAEKMLAGGAVQQALGIPKILTALISSQGSGIRITKSELDSIAKARGLKGDIEGWFNKMSGQGTLTTEQKAQAQTILNDVRERITQKKAIARQASDEIMNAPDRAGVLSAVKRGRDGLDAQQGGGTIRYTSAGKTYNIPAGQEAAFLKDHPGAQK